LPDGFLYYIAIGRARQKLAKIYPAVGAIRGVFPAARSGAARPWALLSAAKAQRKAPA
jgi:hypothetical protein